MPNNDDTFEYSKGNGEKSDGSSSAVPPPETGTGRRDRDPQRPATQAEHELAAQRRAIFRRMDERRERSNSPAVDVVELIREGRRYEGGA